MVNVNDEPVWEGRQVMDPTKDQKAKASTIKNTALVEVTVGDMEGIIIDTKTANIDGMGAEEVKNDRFYKDLCQENTEK